MTNTAGAYMARPRPTLGANALQSAVSSADPAPGLLPGHDLPVAPRIEIVPSRSQKRARPKIAYAAVVVTGVLAIVVTQLLLSVGLSDGAYEISSLQQQQKELDRTNQVLSEQFDTLSSPQNLAASAAALGMVANSTPVYLRLSDGAVLGSPAAAGASAIGGSEIPNSLLSPADAAAAAAAASAEAATAAATAAAQPTSEVASAPPAAPQSADVPWQGALPSPTTR
ncbi:hypothetical protein N1028_17725 [Herbiconiux sp. CPCC 203407]|uniref:Cell division protein FtsL n=1 Tax=Herbiconiux oxytropis TaxID=2970915 RepID=A0AA41XJ55_9MICO|nr:hypothetical protein [Herbiconiux oxytropis]MCS5722808.1 hypothetical protein [Herbiconiux oxytropis]MCS5727738.1 hypothetical protein [Herbiconiux oxytropis]